MIHCNDGLVAFILTGQINQLYFSNHCLQFGVWLPIISEILMTFFFFVIPFPVYVISALLYSDSLLLNIQPYNFKDITVNHIA